MKRTKKNDELALDPYDQLNKKPQAAIIKWMMDQAGIDIPVLAKYLGCQTQSLRNKFTRDSFSIDDLVITAYACGLSLCIKNESEEIRTINPETYFSSKDDSTWERISDLKNKKYAEVRAEYEELKARLAELEKEYQFNEQ